MKRCCLHTENIYVFVLLLLLQLSCHSVAVVLTVVQTKQIRINIHNRENTKNRVQKLQNTVNISSNITTPTYSHTHT
jgi:hypothetical protein